jgi:hypothetical protein
VTMMGRVPALLGLVLVAAVATAVEGRWVAAVVAPGASAPCERALASHFDYRGRYGTHQLALFVDAAAADLHAFNLTEVPLHTSLDGPAAARLWALVAHAPTAHDMAALRAAVGAYPHVTVHDVTLALLPPAVGGRDWPATFEDIPVPRRRVRLAGRFEDSPLHKFVAKRQYNEVIAAAVARVSQAELLATDTYLSSEEIWTRQSASEGLLAAGTYLQSRLRAYGLSVTTFQYSGTYGPVIVAELPGRVRDQYVMVGAHYDSRTTNSADPTARAPGADDNGSGTSAIVEIARIMTSHNTSYEFTVRFLLFSGEEQGLLGSNAYADSLVAQGVEVLAMFNADMLGYRIPGNPIEMGMKDQYITEWLLEESFAISAQYVPDMPVKLSSSCCSDYRSFWEAGYPAIGYFENPTSASTYPHYHKSTDLIQYLDFEQVQKETSALLAMVMTYAVPL